MPRESWKKRFAKFEVKARSWGKRQELVDLAELAFEAGEAVREGKEFPGVRAKASRTHDLDKPPEQRASENDA
ncbi:MAG: hypothetical protein ACRDH6_02575 [Actinomycetota bacterium]